MPKLKRKVLLLALVAMIIFSLAGCGTVSSANKGSTENNISKSETKDDALAFYNGKSLNFIVPYDPGGGYDQYVRLVAPYLQKYIPGLTVVVKNVPGAGSLTGTNELYLSKTNGLTIGIVNTVGIVTAQVAKQEGVKFDLNKFVTIGRFNNEPKVVVVSSAGPFKTLDDLKNAKGALRFAVNGVASSDYVNMQVLKKVMLPQMDVITGYKTSAECEVALLRGEVEGSSGSVTSKYPLILDQKKATPVLIVGSEKDPNLPNVPLLADLVNGPNKELVTGFDNLLQLGRVVLIPPGVSLARVDVLREAFQKSLTDPELLDKAKKQKLDIQFMNGSDTAKLIQDSLNMPPDLKDLMIKSLTS